MLSASTSMPCSSMRRIRSSAMTSDAGASFSPISAMASGMPQCACTSTVFTRRPLTTTSRRRGACARAAGSPSHPMNAMPVSAAAWLTNSLRVVIFSSSPAGSLAFLMNDAVVRGRGCIGAAHTSSIVREEDKTMSPFVRAAFGSKLTNAARTNGLMVLSSSRTMLLVCAAPMQPRPRTTASFMRNASEPAGEEEKMTTRREFVSQAAALTGIAFMGCDGLPAARAQAPRRREVVVSGRRVKTVDVHAHCGMPEAMALMGLKLAPASLVMADERIRRMDEQGIDVEALSINPYWYAAERDVVAKLIGIQNEKLAEICAAEIGRAHV